MLTYQQTNQQVFRRVSGVLAHARAKDLVALLQSYQDLKGVGKVRSDD
jgi:hypothetical protein